MGGSGSSDDGWFILAASSNMNEKTRTSPEQQFVYATKGTANTTNLLLDMQDSPQLVSMFGALLPLQSEGGQGQGQNLLFARDGQLVRSDGTIRGTKSEGLVNLDSPSDGQTPTRLMLFRLGADTVAIIQPRLNRNNECCSGYDLYSTVDGTEQTTTHVLTLYAYLLFIFMLTFIIYMARKAVN